MVKITRKDPAPGLTDPQFDAALAEAGLDLPADIRAEVQRAALALRNAADRLLAYLPPDTGVAPEAGGS